MRFAEIRQTAVKGVDTPDPHHVATPRLLSPYEDRNTGKARPGVHPRDIPKPLHNRHSKRAMGMTRPRTRIGGVALTPGQQPWKPVEPPTDGYVELGVLNG